MHRPRAGCAVDGVSRSATTAVAAAAVEAASALRIAEKALDVVMGKK